jgi:HEAT repeat protein
MAPDVRSPEGDSAGQICTRLHQAYRDHRLYPEDHPTTKASMDRLMELVKAHVDRFGTLALQVEEDRLLLQDDVVYTKSLNSESLAFVMFRDGIRGLTIHEAIEPGELAGFVDCLARADRLADLDHDLVTALWERDLAHIEFDVVDPFLSGDGSSNDAFGELKETVLSRLNELTAGGGPALGEPGKAVAVGGEGGDDPSGDRRGALDPDAVSSTAEDLQASDWESAYPEVLLDDFAVVLLEIIGAPQEIATGEERVIDSLVMVVQKYLGDRNVDGLELVADRLDVLEEQGRRPAGLADEVLGRAATPESLAGLIESLQSASPDAASRLERFLKRMRTCAYPKFLEILATSDDRGVRKLVLDLLRVTGGIPTEHLLPLMNDPRWYVVRNAVQLATESGDPGLVDHLERLLSHPDARVRREILRSLDTFGEKRSLPLLLSALEDVDSPVRILAIRSLGRLGDGRQYPVVLGQVESRDFEDRPSEEVEASLLTLALLGGARAVETLNRLWKRRVFGTRPTALRLAAIQALGAIRSPEATRALGEAARSSEVPVQRAAARALAEAQARTRSPR